MRLGGAVCNAFKTPDEWLHEVLNLNYKAVFFPVNFESDKETVDEYIKLANKNDLVIAEVGAWSNPISKNEEERKKALELCKNQLALAEYTGARCCVNIAGSRQDKWDGPCIENYSEDTFSLIVDSVREIIDAVKPKKTVYSLETMPWIAPDSPDSYLKLIKAIDREGFGVHLDPVNLIYSPSLYYNNSLLLDDCFSKLGKYIKSCHAKDILLSDKLTLHLSEVEIGKGNLDYKTYLRNLSKLDPDTPLMIEHISKHEEYVSAMQYLTDINL